MPNDQYPKPFWQILENNKPHSREVNSKIAASVRVTEFLISQLESVINEGFYYELDLVICERKLEELKHLKGFLGLLSKK